MIPARLLGAALLPCLLLSSGCDRSPTEAEACDHEIGGACWTYLGLEGKWVSAVGTTPWGIVAGTSYDGVFLLESDRWTPLGLDENVVSSIAFVPAPENRLLIGVKAYADEQTHAAVWASRDTGRAWQPWDGGLAAARGGRGSAFALAVDPGAPNRLYMTYFDQVVKSEDGGRTWAYAMGSPQMIGGGSYTSIVISPARDGTLWVAGESSMFQGQLFRSRDWGASWEPHQLDPWPAWIRGDEAVMSLAVNPRDPARLVAGMNAGWMMYSEDGGSTWLSVRLNPAGADANGLQYVGDRLYAATSENFRAPPDGGGIPQTDLGLYRSADNGKTWQVMGAPAEAHGAWAMAQDADGTLLIATLDGVWRVDAGGR